MLSDAVGPVEQPAAAGPTVHVSGAVVNPGLVELSPGARVADALAAAGGSRSDADLGSLNLASPVRDGDQIIVPDLSEIGDRAFGSVDTDGRVNINTAAADELENLPGVGPVLAARIIEYRDTHGPFGEVEDLLDVPGIGEAKLASMRESITLP
jgi:competence protein ComEA